MEFDTALPEIMKLLGEDGVLFVVSDHGCDPTFRGSDHTREYTPLLVWGLGLKEGVALGTRNGFSDVSATILDMFGISNTLSGQSFLKEILL